MELFAQPIQQQYCLKWNNFSVNFHQSLEMHLTEQNFVDCTLVAAEGQKLHCHRFVLSSCSDYFKNVLKWASDTYPCIILQDVPYKIMTSLVSYMYLGHINVEHQELQTLLDIANNLKIKGLADSKTLATLSTKLLNPEEAQEILDEQNGRLSLTSLKPQPVPSTSNGLSSTPMFNYPALHTNNQNIAKIQDFTHFIESMKKNQPLKKRLSVNSSAPFPPSPPTSNSPTGSASGEISQPVVKSEPIVQVENFGSMVN